MGKFIGEDGIARVRLISPGQGTSAYYERAQLERDSAAFKGGLVFIDHPGKKEQRDRPERSLRDLVGPIIGVPQFEAQGKVGPGLYGDVKVATHWQSFIEDLGENIGVSIRATGSRVSKAIDGKRVAVAEKFNPGAGFDFVTQAGRGGKVVPMYEAATTAAEGKVQDWMAHADFTEIDSGRSEELRFLDYLEHGQEGHMPEKTETLVEAQGRATTLTTERDTLLVDNKRMAEALALRAAQEKIVGALGDKKYEKLPDVTKARLVESLTKSTPMKDGKLDEAALETLIETAVKAETEYVDKLTEAKKPGISGMGEGGTPEDDEGHKRLFEMKKKQYLTERKTEEEAVRMATSFCEGR